MSVAGGGAMAVVDVDEASVAAHELGEADDAIGGGVDGGSVGNRDVDAAMECAFSIEGIDSLTEGAGEASLDGPERWSVGGAGPIGERSEAAGPSILESSRSGAGEGRASEGVERIERGLVLFRLHVVVGGQQARIGLEAVDGGDLSGDGAERGYLNILLF